MLCQYFIYISNSLPTRKDSPVPKIFKASPQYGSLLLRPSPASLFANPTHSHNNDAAVPPAPNKPTKTMDPDFASKYGGITEKM